MVYFPPEGGPLENLLFHYTTSAGVSGILDSGVLRASELSKMNDPRENKDFTFNVGSTPREYDNNVVANSVLRDNVRILSFTVEAHDGTRSGHWGRGYSRARNWAQYGENHRGAVLIFDRDALVTESRCVANLSRLYAEHVVYHDRQVQQADDGWMDFTAEEVEPQDVEATVERWITTNWKHIYFEKATDWASEKEYRIVMFGNGAIEVPIASSLRGIVLGEEFPAHEASVLATRLRRQGVHRIGLMQMHWEMGHPGAMVLKNDLPGFFSAGLWSDQVVPRFDGEAGPGSEEKILTCSNCGGVMQQTGETAWECFECDAGTRLDGFRAE